MVSSPVNSVFVHKKNARTLLRIVGVVYLRFLLPLGQTLAKVMLSKMTSWLPAAILAPSNLSYFPGNIRGQLIVYKSRKDEKVYQW